MDYRFRHDQDNWGGEVPVMIITRMSYYGLIRPYKFKIKESCSEAYCDGFGERLHVRFYRGSNWTVVGYAAHIDPKNIFRHFFNWIFKIPSDYLRGNEMFKQFIFKNTY